MGTVVALNGHSDSDLGPEMIEIESDGRNYALFASDLEERAEPLSDESDPN